MGWFKKLYQKYMKGAKANNFPIKQCGLSGDKLRNPHNLDEALVALDYILSPEDKERFQEWSENKFVASLHHNLGRWIRNNWGLWNDESKFNKWFNTIGIWHADDMSGIILTTYYRKVHNLPIKLKKQIQHYIKYWQAAGQEGK